MVSTFAAIEIGSYDVTLEIFEISRKTGIRVVETVRHRLELGKDAYAKRKIGQDMVDDLCETLSDFVRIMNGYNVSAKRVIATSALREADNNLFILGKIRKMTGLEVEILSNSEQRFLQYKAIASNESHFEKMIEKGTAIIDVDGGSIQISLFDKEALVSTQNIRIGSLRIREVLAEAAAQTTDYVSLVEQLIQNEIFVFRKMFLKTRNVENIILAGEFINSYKPSMEHFNFPGTMTREEFDNWYQKVIDSSETDLAMNMDIPVEYASLLQPTAIIYHRLIVEMECSLIWAPGVRLARGAAYEYAEQQKLLKMRHDFENDIIKAARNIGKRYAVNRAHVDNMCMTAQAIFDAIKKRQNYTSRERLLLQIACMLHDVGKYISLSYVAECNYSIIMSNEIIGLSHTEREVIALITRYITMPLPQYDVLAQESSISEREYLLVAEFVAIVRFCNALDRSHTEKIIEMKALLKEQKIQMNLTVRQDFTLEQELLKDKTEFFTEVFGIAPVLKLKKQV